MASSILTPQVAGIHFDDIDQLFRLKITFQVQTPLGNFEREVIVTAGTLAGIVQHLINIWTAVGSEDGVDALNYAPGSMTDLATKIALVVPPPTELLVPPTAPAPDNTTDSTWGSYDGTVGHLTGTDWGQTPVIPS